MSIFNENHPEQKIVAKIDKLTMNILMLSSLKQYNEKGTIFIEYRLIQFE